MLQILIGLFFVIASAAPKLVGDPYAVQMFAEIGGGGWFRYVIGAADSPGASGCWFRGAPGLAALGLAGLMIGATYTQITVFDAPGVTVTPIILGVLVAATAWARRADIAALFSR